MRAHLIGLPIAELDTPALLVDLDAFERNVARMADWARRAGVGVRPHVKSHKMPRVARKQIDAGAIGVTCAKLGEAEVMVAGGIDDILISSEIVGPVKIARLISLARQANLLVVVDDYANAAEISRAATAAGVEPGVLVEVNVGQERCGVQPGAPAAALAVRVAALPGLRFDGLQGYEGHLQHVQVAEERRARNAEAMVRLLASRRAVEERGLAVNIVSTAGTGTCAFAAEHEGITEVQPGSYIWMDSDYLAVEGLEFEGAISLLTAVVSRRRDDAAIVDAGWKSITVEAGLPVVRNLPRLSYAPAGDEHGKLRATDPVHLPPLGHKVELVPSHCDTTLNLHDHLYATRRGRVEAVWEIAARGKVQ